MGPRNNVNRTGRKEKESSWIIQAIAGTWSNSAVSCDRYRIVRTLGNDKSIYAGYKPTPGIFKKIHPRNDLTGPRIPTVPPNCPSCFFFLFFFLFIFFFYFRNAIYGRITISFGHPRDQRTLLASTLPLASSTPTISARSSHFFAVNNNGRKKSSLMDLSGAPTILLPDRPSILYLLTGTCWAWFIGHFLLSIFIEESCTFCDRI